MSEEAKGGNGEQSTSVDPFAGGLERLRETAKWLVTVFAAVGGVLLAGTQLSSLGAVEDPARLVAAFVAAAAGLVAVGGIVWEASQVLTGEPVLLTKLVAEDRASRKEGGKRTSDIEFVCGNPQLLDRYATIEELHRKYSDIVRERNTLLDAGKNPEARTKERDKLYLDRVITQLLYAVRYERTRVRYELTVRHMLRWGALAAVGIVVFAWAANPPEAPQDQSEVTTQVVRTDWFAQ